MARQQLRRLGVGNERRALNQKLLGAGRYPAPIGDVQGIGQKIDVLAEAIPVPSQRKAHIPDFCGKRARANVVDGDPFRLLRKQARIQRLERKAQGLGHAAVAYIDCT